MAILPSENVKAIWKEFGNPPDSDVCGIQWDVRMALEILRLRDKVEDLESQLVYYEEKYYIK